MKNKASWIVGGIVLLLVLFTWSSYNSLVGKNEAVNNQWAQVEAQYQRRIDQIPNLVSSVQGAMKQETAVFGAVTEARTRYMNASGVDAKVAAAGQVESTFAKVLAVMENYPQLKSIDTVQTLMAEITGTENRVSVERMRFNDKVTVLNISVKSFPGNIFAGMFGFNQRAYFAAAKGAEEAPKVNF
ncbi:MAG: LemA family protein [Candidatus Jorgensenbacteria bacterium]|nr:LemA family protein [Candidatus Jorgensenbacteria bacterium]